MKVNWNNKQSNDTKSTQRSTTTYIAIEIDVSRYWKLKYFLKLQKIVNLYTFLAILINNIVLYIYIRTSLTKFAVTVYLRVYLIDGDLVEAETCGKDISNKL